MSLVHFLYRSTSIGIYNNNRVIEQTSSPLRKSFIYGRHIFTQLSFCNFDNRLTTRSCPPNWTDSLERGSGLGLFLIGSSPFKLLCYAYVNFILSLPVYHLCAPVRLLFLLFSYQSTSSTSLYIFSNSVHTDRVFSHLRASLPTLSTFFFSFFLPINLPFIGHDSTSEKFSHSLREDYLVFIGNAY